MIKISQIKEYILKNNINSDDLIELYHNEVMDLLDNQDFMNLNLNNRETTLFTTLFEKENMFLKKYSYYETQNFCDKKISDIWNKLCLNKDNLFSHYSYNYEHYKDKDDPNAKYYLNMGVDKRNKLELGLLSPFKYGGVNIYNINFFDDLKTLIINLENNGKILMPAALMMCYFTDVKYMKGEVSFKKSMTKKELEKKEQTIALFENSTNLFNDEFVQNWLNDCIDSMGLTENEKLFVKTTNEFVCLTENHIFNYDTESNLERLKKAVRLIENFSQKTNQKLKFFSSDIGKELYGLGGNSCIEIPLFLNTNDLSRSISTNMKLYLMNINGKSENYNKYKTPKSEMQKEIVELLSKLNEEDVKENKKELKDIKFEVKEVEVSNENKKIVKCLIFTNTFTSNIEKQLINILNDNDEKIGEFVLYPHHKNLEYEKKTWRVVSYTFYDKNLDNMFWEHFFSSLPENFYHKENIAFVGHSTIEIIDQMENELKHAFSTTTRVLGLYENLEDKQEKKKLKGKI